MYTLPIWILCIDFVFTIADELPNLILYCVQFTEGINFDYIVFNRVACQTYQRKLVKLSTKTNSEYRNSALIRSELSSGVISSYLNE